MIHRYAKHSPRSSPRRRPSGCCAGPPSTACSGTAASAHRLRSSSPSTANCSSGCWRSASSSPVPRLSSPTCAPWVRPANQVTGCSTSSARGCGPSLPAPMRSSERSWQNGSSACPVTREWIDVSDVNGIDVDRVRHVARQLLANEARTDWVRAAEDDPAAFPSTLWDAAVAAGWTGVVIPESFGGAGASFVELAIVLIELGRALAPGPFLGSCVLGTGALLAGGPSPHQERWLPQLARGEA